MSVDECKTANWSDVGLRDGLAGRALSVLDDRVKDCAEAKVRVDTPRYLAGRERGLLDYCRLDNAVRVGLAGHSYAGVCAGGEFGRRFEVAHEVYEARRALDHEAGRRHGLESRLREASKDDERHRAREALQRHDSAMRRLRDRLYWAESALSRLR
jgi:hypothetical protein